MLEIVALTFMPGTIRRIDKVAIHLVERAITGEGQCKRDNLTIYDLIESQLLVGVMS